MPPRAGFGSRRPGRLGLVLALGSLLLASGLVALAAAADLGSRSAGPESAVRRYFVALEAGEVEVALAELAPSAREAATNFVEYNVFNHYRIEGIAVRQPSVLKRLSREAPGATDVTVFLDIVQAADGQRWQAAPRVPLVEIGGRWYLGRAPLME